VFPKFSVWGIGRKMAHASTNKHTRVNPPTGISFPPDGGAPEIPVRVPLPRVAVTRIDRTVGVDSGSVTGTTPMPEMPPRTNSVVMCELPLERLKLAIGPSFRNRSVGSGPKSRSKVPPPASRRVPSAGSDDEMIETTAHGPTPRRIYQLLRWDVGIPTHSS
jgi:hypothetical protein